MPHTIRVYTRGHVQSRICTDPMRTYNGERMERRHVLRCVFRSVHVQQFVERPRLRCVVRCASALHTALCSSPAERVVLLFYSRQCLSTGAHARIKFAKTNKTAPHERQPAPYLPFFLSSLRW